MSFSCAASWIFASLVLSLAILLEICPNESRTGCRSCVRLERWSRYLKVKVILKVVTRGAGEGNGVVSKHSTFDFDQ